MSTWYKTGTVAVTNGSATVTGTGTAWVANVKVGEAFRLFGGQRLYEVTAVVSDAELTISPAYMDTSQTGQAYEIVPIKGFLKAAYDALQSALSTINGYISGPLAGLFGDGTAGEPSIGFESDPNTGFFRAAADQIGAATNGIRRWLLTSTAFQVDVPITGTAVVQSKTDTTAGRIPTVGWMGWGEAAATPPSLTDFGSYPASGAYRWIGNATTDGPDALGWWSTALVMKTTGGAAFLAMRAQDSNNPPVTYVGRADTDGLNVQWTEVFTQASILGAVAQSGGVPTGAVIERGSNANGEYVRFADGTQICTVTGLSAAYIAASYCAANWTFPAAFASSPNAVIGIIDGNTWGASPPASGIVRGDVVPVTGNNVTNAASIQVWARSGVSFGASDAVPMIGLAVGRWF